MVTSTLEEVFEAKHVLITGGLGFIGSNLTRRLVDLGSHVEIVDSLIPTYGGNEFNIDGLEGSVEVSHADVRNGDAMAEKVKGKHFIFNLAGQTSHIDSMRDPVTDLDINCRAQLSILEACRKHNGDAKLVFASTRQIYGKPDYLPVDERHILRPVDVNGINKMAGEWYHILYSNVYGIRSCALRLTNTYGPRMRVKDARQTFLGLWVRLLLEQKPIEVWNGSQKRDYTYVDDAVDAFLLAGASEVADGKVFNLGGTAVHTILETAEIMVDVHGSGAYEVMEFPADRKRIDIGDYYADYFSIMSTLGWQPKTDLRDGLERTLDYFRTNLDRYLERP